MYITSRVPNDVIGHGTDHSLYICLVFKHNGPQINAECMLWREQPRIAILGDKVVHGHPRRRLIALDRITGDPLCEYWVGDVNLA